MTPNDKLQMSHEIADIAAAIVTAMADPNVIWPPEQSTDGQNANVQLSNLSRSIANSAALDALDAAAPDFAKMTQATADAKSALARIQSDAAKINAVLSIAAKAITFATQLAAGGPVLATILSAGNSLSATSKAA
jgi:hypothetical protein